MTHSHSRDENSDPVTTGRGKASWEVQSLAGQPYLVTSGNPKQPLVYSNDGILLDRNGKDYVSERRLDPGSAPLEGGRRNRSCPLACRSLDLPSQKSFMASTSSLHIRSGLWKPASCENCAYCCLGALRVLRVSIDADVFRLDLHFLSQFNASKNGIASDLYLPGSSMCR